MQDRYAGDVGDFGKFALLRFLFDESNDRIGVIWYLFPDESHTEDGKHIKYLENRDFRGCDNDLCKKLYPIAHGKRSVTALEKAGLLPTNTHYFSERLDFHQQFSSQRLPDRHQREEKRRVWLEKAVLSVSKCNVIFLDPDNGLQIPSCPKIGQMRSGKFAYYPEISRLNINKDVTVIYHHLGRKGTHQDQIRLAAAKLRENINPTGTIFALRYKPYSPRAYFILTAKSAENRTREDIHSFLRSKYDVYWDSYYEEDF